MILRCLSIHNNINNQNLNKLIINRSGRDGENG